MKVFTSLLMMGFLIGCDPGCEQTIFKSLFAKNHLEVERSITFKRCDACNEVTLVLAAGESIEFQLKKSKRGISGEKCKDANVPIQVQFSVDTIEESTICKEQHTHRYHFYEEQAECPIDQQRVLEGFEASTDTDTGTETDTATQ